MLVRMKTDLRGSECWGAGCVENFGQDVSIATIAGAAEVNNIGVSRINGNGHVIRTLSTAKSARADGGGPCHGAGA